MRYSKNLFRQAISQWRDCYIDYEYLKIFISVIKKIVQELQEMSETIDDDKTNRNTGSSGNVKSNQQTITISKSEVKLSPQNIVILNDVNDKLRKIIQEINVMFCQAFYTDIEICRGFCQIKYHQIQQKYQLFFMYASLVDDRKKIKVLIPYVQYTYIEAIYLTRMYQSNIQGQRKILKKHKKNAKKIVETPSATLPNKLDTKILDKMVDQIQNYYVQLSHGLLKKKQKTKLSRKYLRGLAKDPETTNKDSFTFGLFVGSIISVIIFLSLMLAFQDKSVQTDPVFNRDFPTWRGISFIIFYIWVIGMNVYFFEKYMISHKIIFDFQSHHYSNSTRIFKIAGLLSTVFVLMFTIYALNLADFYSLGRLQPWYLSLIVWVFFLVFMFNPFPIFYFRSRLFTFFLFARIIASPFIGVPFIVTWATDQLLSLITPFEDMVYSICYFTGGLDFTDLQVTHNTCRNPAKVAVFIFAAIVFSYRIVQCMRQGYDKGKYWREFQFYNTIKYIFSLLTLVFSYIWKSGNSNIFAGWLTFAIISTLYSYVWDLKVDWFLLNRKSEYCLLRDKLTYLPRNYYIFMFLNLVLRLAWVLTLSQNITDKMFGSPELFRLVAGALQIIRRGIWNLLRVEREHLKNCEQFKALPSMSKTLENKIEKTIQQNKDKINIESIQRIGQQEDMKGIQEDLVQIQPQEEQNKTGNKQMRPWKPKTYKDIQQKIQKHQELKKKVLTDLKIKETLAKQLIKIAKLNLK